MKCVTSCAGKFRGVYSKCEAVVSWLPVILEGAKDEIPQSSLGLLALLLVITYLDRVCISVAGPRMQEALHIGPVAWGWVTGVFTLSYAVI